MSTSYGFLCRTHSPHLSSAHDLRRSDVEKLLARRTELPTALAFDQDMLMMWSGQFAEYAYWLAQHPSCDVVIEDEYGKAVEV